LQPKKRLQYISNKDIVRLEVAIASPRDRLLLQTLYETGCTINEAVNLRSADVDELHNRINFPADITKSRKSKIAWVSDELIQNLAGHISTHDTRGKSRYIFGSRQSAQMTTKRARQLIAAYGKKAGLGKVLPQMIRYAHVLHAVEKGIPLDAVEKQTGIDKIRIVQICEAVSKPEPEDPYRTFFERPFTAQNNRRKRHEKARR
jgi:integrase/recombinase XerD